MKLVIVIVAIGALISLSVGVYAVQNTGLDFRTVTSSPPETENRLDQAENPEGLTTQIEAEASEKEIWEELGLPYDPNEGETEEANQAILAEDESSEAIERELARIDAKEGTAFALVMADDRVKAELEGTHEVTSDFLPSEYRSSTDMDRMTLSVTGREVLTGSWETAYTSTLTDRFALVIEMKDGTITSIEKKPLDDLGGVFTYADAEKEIIRTALQDSFVQAAVKQKEDASAGLAISLRPITNLAINCPPESCWLVVIREVNSHATLVVWLNSEEGKVVQTKAVDGW